MGGGGRDATKSVMLKLWTHVTYFFATAVGDGRSWFGEKSASQELGPESQQPCCSRIYAVDHVKDSPMIYL